MTQDFYDVLGVGRDADEEEIQQAFRERASKYHPDVSDDPDAEEKFKAAKKAKEVLTDDRKRQLYDQLGHDQYLRAEKQGGVDGGQGGAGAGAGGRRQGSPFGGMGGMGGGGAGNINDIFEQFFGGGGGRGNGRSAGRDLQTRLDIDLEEAHAGAHKRVTVERPEQCPTCDGAGHPPDADARRCPECDGRGQVTQVQQTPFGRVQQSRTCPRCEGDGEVYSQTCGECNGDGQVLREATLDVEIPAGIRDGQTLRMEGEGAPGDRGTPDGDLLIEVSVADHPEFERDGADLHHRHAISFPQAVFGGTVTVPTVDGEASLDVPTGTQSGETFRLRDRGMPRLRGRGNGDLYVEVHVVTPETLNDEQREALEAFAEAGGEEVEVEQGFFERLRNSL